MLIRTWLMVVMLWLIAESCSLKSNSSNLLPETVKMCPGPMDELVWKRSSWSSKAENHRRRAALTQVQPDFSWVRTDRRSCAGMRWWGEEGEWRVNKWMTVMIHSLLMRVSDNKSNSFTVGWRQQWPPQDRERSVRGQETQSHTHSHRATLL